MKEGKRRAWNLDSYGTSYVMTHETHKNNANDNKDLTNLTHIFQVIPKIVENPIKIIITIKINTNMIHLKQKLGSGTKGSSRLQQNLSNQRWSLRDLMANMPI